MESQQPFKLSIFDMTKYLNLKIRSPSKAKHINYNFQVTFVKYLLISSYETVSGYSKLPLVRQAIQLLHKNDLKINI